jgi:MFS family permease
MTTDAEQEILQSLKHNIIVNVLDGAFFGMALGFASFVTVLPLFVSAMTSSAILIGLIPAIHTIGWQLPQVFTARRVARQRRYKPMVLAWTIQERLPFLGLALTAWYASRLGGSVTLALTFGLLIWQGLGGGFTATAWQSLVGKIIPLRRRGTFFGLQASAADLLASLSAIIAGFILEQRGDSSGFALCFLLAFISLGFSWFFLAQTHEPERAAQEMAARPGEFWSGLGNILRRDANFRWFLVARSLSQLAIMGWAFYTVFAVEQHGVSKLSAGWMTATLLAVKIVANPVMGWLSDHWSHKATMEFGLGAAALSALLAYRAPGQEWFYLVFALAGVADGAIWTVALSMTLGFGSETERPAYIGLANTLIAPANILAPFLGGWLAQLAGYPAAFLVSAVGGLAAALVFQFQVRDPVEGVRLAVRSYPGD